MITRLDQFYNNRLRALLYLHRTIQRGFFLFLIVLSLNLLSCLSIESPKTPKIREEHETQHEWALRLEKPGLPNLYRVTKDLYRGAQPTREGIGRLKEMGIKTIINLRSSHSDRNEIGKLKFDYEHIKMKAWHPEDKDVIRFLKIVTDKDRTPVFVHCQHGADRTGMMCAIYRIAVCGWNKNEAIKEMTEGGFGYHKVWKDLINYIEELDVDGLKKKAGLGRKYAADTDRNISKDTHSLLIGGGRTSARC